MRKNTQKCTLGTCEGEQNRQLDTTDVEQEFDEEIEIEVGEIEEICWQKKAMPANGDGCHKIEKKGKIDEDDFKIFIYRAALQKLERWANKCLDLEVGGILVGNGYEHDDESWYLEIHDAIWGPKAISSRYSLVLTTDSWIQMNYEKDDKYPEARIVGWWHTHPGFGAFLSGFDRFICTHSFGLPWQIAMVIDPVGDDVKLFCWKDGNIKEREGFFLCIPFIILEWEIEQTLSGSQNIEFVPLCTIEKIISEMKSREKLEGNYVLINKESGEELNSDDSLLKAGVRPGDVLQIKQLD